jgi:hypothetical protein
MVVPTGRRWRRSGNSVPPWRRVCRRFGASVPTFRRTGCSRAKVAAFVPEYGLAPEHPFPAAVDETLAAYRGLVKKGFAKIALAGDSAGGGLALVLLSSLVVEQPKTILHEQVPTTPQPSELIIRSGDSRELRLKTPAWISLLAWIDR